MRASFTSSFYSIHSIRPLRCPLSSLPKGIERRWQRRTRPEEDTIAGNILDERGIPPRKIKEGRHELKITRLGILINDIHLRPGDRSTLRCGHRIEISFGQ